MVHESNFVTEFTFCELIHKRSMSLALFTNRIGERHGLRDGSTTSRLIMRSSSLDILSRIVGATGKWRCIVSRSVICATIRGFHRAHVCPVRACL